MAFIAGNIIIKDKLKYFITIAGISISIVLTLFLLNVYNGIRTGAIGYVEDSKADIWVCQKNSMNLLRSNSILDTSLAAPLKEISGVNDITGLSRIMTSAEIKGTREAFVGFGIDPENYMSQPQRLFSGKSDFKNGEAIIDKSLAQKHNLKINDSLLIDNKYLKVAGISERTNAVIAQISFITLSDASNIFKAPDKVSYFLIKIQPGFTSQQVIDSIKNKFDFVEAFGKNEFIQNNLDEVEKGVLPIIWTTSVFGLIVAIFVITLMLYNSVLEKKEDYALIKAIGGSRTFLIGIILQLSLLCSLSGFIIGVVVNLLLNPVLMRFIPELTVEYKLSDYIIMFFIANIIGLLGSLIPLRKILKIYPAEAFRV